MILKRMMTMETQRNPDAGLRRMIAKMEKDAKVLQRVKDSTADFRQGKFVEIGSSKKKSTVAKVRHAAAKKDDEVELDAVSAAFHLY
jgi:hypothetical protein